MKKKCFILSMIALGLIAIFALYRFVCTQTIPDAGIGTQVVTVMDNNGCIACHDLNAPTPWYGKIPLMGNVVKADIEAGTRFIDLTVVVSQIKNGEIPTLVDLLKIEHSVDQETMPPLKYTAMHWGTGLDKKEKAVLKQWITSVKETHYRSSLSSQEFALEPVSPIMDSIPVDMAKAALGNKLYHDVRLSANNTISCATCHLLDKGGVDGLKTSKGIHDQIGGINAPTVYNAALNFSQFWDGRAKDLQAQAGGPPLDMLEMGSSWPQIIGKLQADRFTSTEFAAIYPEGITANSITDAIAEFEKLLLTPNSLFDKYLKGDKSALSQEQVEGYELFKENSCASCHAGANMGGLSYEYMGIVKNTYFKDRGTQENDKDKGRIGVTSDPNDLHKYKTPSLRNIALTAPYFHDGTVLTLADATEKMFVYQLGEKPSQDDVTKIVSFMKTLTGESLSK